MRERRENSCRGTLCGTHSAAHYRDKREVVDYLEMVGLYYLDKALRQLFALTLKLVSVNDNAHRVDTCRHMLGEYPVILEHLKQPSHEALVGIHSVRFDRYRGKILLARHKHRNTDIFTCLAGYMEPGETLEECVAREVQEEAGITVKNIRYVGSKSWPFPDQLMLAFRAEWESGELVPETSEIHELHWFDKNNLPAIPLRGSVAHDLITGVMK